MAETENVVQTEVAEASDIQQETGLTTAQSYVPTMWNDAKLLSQAFRAAKYLAASDLVPESTYKNNPGNCLIALDIANRLNMPPMLVCQNLFVVKGKPSWSGSFCAAAINGCGRFEPIEYVFVDEGGGGCYVQTTRISDGKVCKGTTVTLQMATDEGWMKNSKWKTMPQQMLQYRAAAFFARAYCPEVLLGIHTADENRDVYGDDEEKKDVITVEL